MWINIFYPSTKIKYWLKLRLLLTQIKIYSKLINLLFHTKHKIIFLTYILEIKKSTRKTYVPYIYIFLYHIYL